MNLKEAEEAKHFIDLLSDNYYEIIRNSKIAWKNACTKDSSDFREVVVIKEDGDIFQYEEEPDSLNEEVNSGKAIYLVDFKWFDYTKFFDKEEEMQGYSEEELVDMVFDAYGIYEIESQLSSVREDLFNIINS